MTPTPARALVAAATAFAIALLIFGAALVRALGTDDLDDGVPREAAPVRETDDSDTRDRPLSMEAIMLAIDNDPFQPDRIRPAQRYRLPGDVDPPPPPLPPMPPAPPDFRVRGTAVTPDGGFAVLQIGDAPARVVAIGEYLGGYRLDRVTPETALMVNDEREITVRVDGPVASVAGEAAGPQRVPMRPGQGNARGMQQRAANPREAQAAAQMIEALLQRAQAQGANPQALQALQRMLEQRGIDGIRNMDIQVQDGSMTIRRVVPDTTASQLNPPLD